MAVEHQQELERRGKKMTPEKPPKEKASPWGQGPRQAAAETPFRKRKVGSDEAVPVAVQPEKAEVPAPEGEEVPHKKRGPRRTPPRKGGKRPAVAARKAAHKALKANAGKKPKNKHGAKRKKKK